MKQQTLMHSSIIAAIIIAAAVGVGLVNGFPAAAQFVSVDPFGDKNIGDIFTITGTTNLPVGTELLVLIEPASFEPEGGINGEFSGAAGTVDVIAGTGDTNTWSMEINTSTLNPVKMRVNVSVLTGDVKKGDLSTSEPSGTREFTLHPAPGSSGTGQGQEAATGMYIRIDPVADITTGDLLTVTGSTNLPEGTTLMVVAGGTAGNTFVGAGAGGINRYSTVFDTSIMKPGTKTITVTDMVGDPAKADYRTGTVNGTGSFTLKGTFLATDTLVQVTSTTGDYIRINTIGDKKVGDQFLITGTTSLPAGAEVLWQVMPDTGTPPAGLDGNSQMSIGGNSVVTTGDGTANRISLPADMTNMKPQKYVVIVGKPKRDQSQGPPFSIEIGDLYGTTYFTLS